VEQYGGYLGDLARGDLGMSIRHDVPVADVIAERLPWTLLLVAAAMAVATTVGLVAGIHSGWRRDRPVDRALLTLFMGIRNFPVFFLGSLLLFVFAVKLRWFPLSGATTPFAESSLNPLRRTLDVAHHLVLPATVLAVPFVAAQYLMMRAGMVGELGSDYLLGGRVKGLGERRLKYRYAARNAMLPVVTLVGTEVGFAVSLSLLVETVFAYPGVGRLISQSVAFRDYPVLQGSFLVLSLIVVSVNAVTDAVSARLDPRTRA
ncbi:MAG: ABC transporter permease, partial [Actinomycetota bacterium]|nr:ABC transporter permease [Actinomycetota bacterium]